MDVFWNQFDDPSILHNADEVQSSKDDEESSTFPSHLTQARSSQQLQSAIPYSHSQEHSQSHLHSQLTIDNLNFSSLVGFEWCLCLLSLYSVF